MRFFCTDKCNCQFVGKAHAGEGIAHLRRAADRVAVAIRAFRVNVDETYGCGA
jgi:hypothetical protein